MSNIVPRKQNTPGRPPKISDEIITSIIGALKDCQSYKSAAAIAGISEKTFYNYRDRGVEVLLAREENPNAELTEYDDLYVRFVTRIAEAEAEIEGNLVKRIYNAGAETWQANAWILERRFGDRWGQKQHVEVGGAAGRPITFTLRIPGMNAPEDPGILEAEVEEIDDE